jgi:uncharacterized delta-60 repeat protein
MPTVHAAAGDLDPTFGNGGKVTTSFTPASDFAQAVVLQPDGKIIAAGVAAFDFDFGFFALARYNPDGNLDNGFGASGRVTTDFSEGNDVVTGIVLQPDGKIIAAGFTSNISDFALARYNPDGSLDSGFGSGGKVVTDFFGARDQAFSVALQPDGKIVVAGRANTSFEVQSDFALARYNPDGSLDTSFGSGGKVTTEFSGSSDGEATALALQPDGKIIVAGSAFGSSSSPMPGSDFALVRYNPDGSLDSTFGAGGKLTTDFFGLSDMASGIAIQSDGRIIAAGTASFDRFSPFSDFALARYHPNGSLDSTFGVGGKTTTDLSGTGDRASDLLLQPDGKIVAAGDAFDFTNFDSAFALARYRLDGSLDSSFGSGGKVVTGFSGSSNGIQAIAQQPDGKIVAAGSGSIENTGPDFALARYEADSFNICIQDESNGSLLRINSITGDYQFMNCNGFTIGGTGVLSTRGCTITLQDTRSDRRVLARFDTCQNIATASIQVFTLGVTLSISDRNTANNGCTCNE